MAQLRVEVLTHCGLVTMVTRICINIGSGNNFPDSAKTLPEPILSYRQLDPDAFI